MRTVQARLGTRPLETNTFTPFPGGGRGTTTILNWYNEAIFPEEGESTLPPPHTRTQRTLATNKAVQLSRLFGEKSHSSIRVARGASHHNDREEDVSINIHGGQVTTVILNRHASTNSVSNAPEEGGAGGGAGLQLASYAAV